MAIINCPNCGNPVSDKAAHCPKCKHTLQPPIFCPECGKTVSHDASECPSCAYPLQTECACSTPGEGNTPPKKNKAMLILAIVFGVLCILTAIIYFTMNSHRGGEEEQAWQAAQDSASISALIDFMRNYPDGVHYAEADSMMRTLKQKDDQAWGLIVFSTDPKSFREYLTDFPKGQYGTLALNKIDSLDWVKASRVNTPESYAEYINNHPNGTYLDQAQDKTDKIAATTLTEDEKAKIARTMTTYYEAVQAGDETTVLSFFEPIIDQYYNKKNATKSDVLTNLRKMLQSDITQIRINVNNNFTNSKDENGNYHTSFPIDITYERDEPGQETYTSSVVTATLNPNMRITSITSEKVSALKE